VLQNVGVSVRVPVASSGMLRHVALVRTDVSEELGASFIRVTIVGLGTTLAVTNNGRTLRRTEVLENSDGYRKTIDAGPIQTRTC
jgi:hypothetical protein